MNRFLIAALALAYAPSALASSVYYSICNQGSRDPADDKACACAHSAKKAENTAVTTGAPLSYSEWNSGFTLGLVNMDPPDASHTNSCFDLDDRVNPGTMSMRNSFTGPLHDVVNAASVQYGYSPSFSLSDVDVDGRDDSVQGFIGFGAETEIEIAYPEGGLAAHPMGTHDTDIVDAFGSIGVVHDGNGRTVEGVMLEDMNNDGIDDVRVFLSDYTVLDLIAVAPSGNFWDITGY